MSVLGIILLAVAAVWLLANIYVILWIRRVARRMGEEEVFGEFDPSARPVEEEAVEAV